VVAVHLPLKNLSSIARSIHVINFRDALYRARTSDSECRNQIPSFGRNGRENKKGVENPMIRHPHPIQLFLISTLTVLICFTAHP